MSKNEKLYESLKSLNDKSIVIIKNGIFYYTYNDDAIVLWHLFDYKIR